MTSQSEITLSSPRWGFAGRHHAGGAALIAFTLAMWALFLGTVGAPIERQGSSRAAVAAAK